MSSESEVTQTLQAVREVRVHLRGTFPFVDHHAVHEILATRGIRRYPDALMLVQPPGIDGPDSATQRRRLPNQPLPRPRKGRPLPFFSEPYYRLANPDLRDLDLPMVLHWQIHGRLEGRSPHPFIDVGWLSTQIPDALPGEVVDMYLTDRKQWLASPSRYVEAEWFMLSGPWDGTTHPLLQIFRDYPVHPWLRGSLAVIDLAEADDELQMAAGILTARNPGLALLTSFSVFEPAAVRSEANLGPGSFRVVPGFVLAVGRQLISRPGDDVLSNDGTAVRLTDRVVVLDTREAVTCTKLIFITAPLEKAAVERLSADAAEGTLVAPFDLAQQTTLQRLRVPTLTLSRQITVDATSVELVGGPS